MASKVRIDENTSTGPVDADGVTANGPGQKVEESSCLLPTDQSRTANGTLCRIARGRTANGTPRATGAGAHVAEAARRFPRIFDPAIWKRCLVPVLAKVKRRERVVLHSPHAIRQLHEFLDGYPPTIIRLKVRAILGLVLNEMTKNSRHSLGCLGPTGGSGLQRPLLLDVHAIHADPELWTTQIHSHHR